VCEVRYICVGVFFWY